MIVSLVLYNNMVFTQM